MKNSIARILFAALFAVSMSLSFTACNNGGNSDDNMDHENGDTTQVHDQDGDMHEH